MWLMVFGHTVSSSAQVSKAVSIDYVGGNFGTGRDLDKGNSQAPGNLGVRRVQMVGQITRDLCHGPGGSQIVSK